MGDQKTRANINGNLGSYPSLERSEEALHYYEGMLRLITCIGDQKGIGDSKSCLGRIYFRLRE